MELSAPPVYSRDFTLRGSQIAREIIGDWHAAQRKRVDRLKGNTNAGGSPASVLSPYHHVERNTRGTAGPDGTPGMPSGSLVCVNIPGRD